MTTPLYIIGAGGFGREVYSIIQALSAHDPQLNVQGFVDDAPSTGDMARIAALGQPYVGTIADLARRTAPFQAVVAVGSPSARCRIVQRMVRAPATYPLLIHPDATVGLRVEIGEGTVISAGARLSTAISIGRHVHIDQNATVGHDCVLHDYSRINPQACLSGTVVLGERALVGASATILPGLLVGSDSIVGAGAVVVRDVREGATVKGVPAE